MNLFGKVSLDFDKRKNFSRFYPEFNIDRVCKAYNDSLRSAKGGKNF